MQLLHTQTKLLLRDTNERSGDRGAATTTTNGFKLDSAKHVRDHDDYGQRRRVDFKLEAGTQLRDRGNCTNESFLLPSFGACDLLKWARV